MRDSNIYYESPADSPERIVIYSNLPYSNEVCCNYSRVIGGKEYGLSASLDYLISNMHLTADHGITEHIIRRVIEQMRAMFEAWPLVPPFASGKPRKIKRVNGKPWKAKKAT